jgi:hypothetical protein
MAASLPGGARPRTGFAWSRRSPRRPRRFHMQVQLAERFSTIDLMQRRGRAETTRQLS